MLSTKEIKGRYPSLCVDGYLFVHRTMVKSLADLAGVMGQLDTLSKEQVGKLREWYEFFYLMVEHHHHEEDDQQSEFSFPTMHRRYPIANLEQLQSDHEELKSNMDEIKQKLEQFQTETDQASRASLIALLKHLTTQSVQLLDEHLSREEEVILPLYNQHYPREEQIKLGKIMEKRMRQDTPKQYAAYGLPWFLSGLTQEERTDFLKTLPLPPRLLMQFRWNKKYADFSSVVHD